ncbi:MAG: ABC transporter permease [Chloroflexi bacterium]|jgi:peptide/nickel transport system permease protein|nr:ABC transporter permease [Chloroflexota bacterium]
MNHIWNIIYKRLAFGLLTLFVISVLISLGVDMLPGDLAQALLGQHATPEALAAIRVELGLNKPLHVRYLNWLGNIVQWDLGQSLLNNRDVADLIGRRLGNTLFLASIAAIVAVPLALFLGMIAALYRESLFDKIISMVTLTAISFPEFFVAYILIVIFSVQFNIFPSMSNVMPHTEFWDRLHAIALPVLTLVLVVVAHMMRLTRAAIINVLTRPYIETAQLKGMKSSWVIMYHALPNALSPIINVIVINLAYLVVGVVVVEVVFVYPGLGQLMVDAVTKRDLPVVQATGLIFASTYIVLNLTADILSILANPRLRQPALRTAEVRQAE